MTGLLMILTAPVQRLSDGRVRLDIKFIEGLKRHRDLWDGDIRCLLWETGAPIPFGRDCAPEDVAMPIQILPAGTRLQSSHLQGAQIILAAADSWLTHDIPALTPVPVVYVVEYTLKTRLDILRLDPGAGVLRKARSAWWLIRQEGRMRRAFRRAAGLQCNGFPAYAAYRDLTPRPMLYLDGRVSENLFATPQDQAARRAAVLAGSPLRLVNFGRLEPMKGAQDFLPFAQALKARGVPFRLDIFGTGALDAQIRSGIQTQGLADHVTLHAPVDFETELVPWMRQNADVFLSCHRQDDPSCAYIEAMGCGLAVLGYDNAMLAGLIQDAPAGACVPLGNIGALAAGAERLTQDRTGLAAATDQALGYAQAHAFEREFALRMQHLRDVAQAQ